MILVPYIKLNKNIYRTDFTEPTLLYGWLEFVIVAAVIQVKYIGLISNVKFEKVAIGRTNMCEMNSLQCWNLKIEKDKIL